MSEHKETNEQKIEKKRQILKDLHKTCLEQSLYYKKRYKSLKKKDDFTEVIITGLNMSAMSLTISGFALPPLLIASATCAGVGLVASQIQKAYQSKVKLANFNVCVNQYDELSREIIATLHRNHFTSKEYSEFISFVNSRMNMIDDSRLL